MPPWVTAPNILTLGRIGITPWIGMLIARGDYRTALPVLFFTGMSDAADGFLARRFGMGSALGAKLDPIADKFLAGTVFLALAFNGALPWWYVALAFSRDLLILGFGTWVMTKGIQIDLSPTIWGKLSTALQLLLAGGIVMQAALGLAWLALFLPVLLWSSTALTLWSGVHYGWMGWRGLAHHRHSLD